ncbi:hypothetical protein LZ30DRAFT_338133 [Colletotrichum cereale]|nr:hypothetical protein LZ30DRAFT_338133 [Colletotrichum cereale]
MAIFSFSSEDGCILVNHERLYSPSRRLRISPHKPLLPYGSHLYPIPQGMTSADMMLSEEEKTFSFTKLVFNHRNAPRVRDESNQQDEDVQMEVEILQMIGGNPGSGYSPGPQKVLCRVVVAPSTSPQKQEHEMPVGGQLLFLKIFDALFWHKVIGITKRLLKVTVQADGAFSDEFGAYHFLYEHGRTGFSRTEFDRTGYSHAAPQFFGGWTAKVTSAHPTFANQSRQVAVLALEYVHGVCLESLFTSSGPIPDRFKLYRGTPAPARFSTDLDQRMQIVAQLMDGTVAQEFLGLDHTELHPKNVIITMQNMGQPLEKPRAVLVGYGRALVDDVRTEPAGFWKHFPTKHHPIIRFGWHRLDPFGGWIPLEWRGPEDDIDDAPLLDKWMLETFGSLKGNPEYTTFVRETPPTGVVPEEQQP